MRFVSLAAALALSTLSGPSWAVLPVGAKAPDFQTQGALGGKRFTLKLRQQLRKGPLVLYFFPAAFTKGCTLETREFAEAIDDFRKEGAQVVGMANDPIDKLSEFSEKECRSKFPMAVATPALITAYDVKMPALPQFTPEIAAKMAGRASRTSYVITPDGRIIYVHTDLDYKDHVKNTLAAVRQWRAARKSKT
jgi:peroxiredoxin